MLKKLLKLLEKLIVTCFVLGALVCISFLVINAYMIHREKIKFMTVEEAVELDEVDCIIVLGASVKNGDTPSPMLEDRLLKGIELYNAGCAPKIIMSGDHGTEYYNEVGVMKDYAIEHGVPSSDIFMDHSGFSTYETMYRAKEIFGAKKVLIVTQEYHLTRCLYVAEKLGLEAYGVSTDYKQYSNQYKRDIREFLARGKDFGQVIVKPAPTLMGSPVSLLEDGDVTNEPE